MTNTMASRKIDQNAGPTTNGTNRIHAHSGYTRGGAECRDALGGHAQTAIAIGRTPASANVLHTMVHWRCTTLPSSMGVVTSRTPQN
jgi:hypothetical protein